MSPWSPSRPNLRLMAPERRQYAGGTASLGTYSGCCKSLLRNPLIINPARPMACQTKVDQIDCGGAILRRCVGPACPGYSGSGQTPQRSDGPQPTAAPTDSTTFFW